MKWVLLINYINWICIDRQECMKHLNISQYLYSTKWYEATKKVRSYEKGTKGLRRDYKISYQLRKRYETTKKIQSYEKVRMGYKDGTKLQKRYEFMKKVRSFEKGTKGLRRGHKISYQVTKKVHSYEKGTKLRKRYQVTKRYDATKKVRTCYEISYERSWLRSYQVTR
jgi:ABC-type uncharacterized transport system auxiliary subunit